ncbi:MAG: hypothetical protein ABL872_10100 [Lacibacter sp.]
MQKSKQTNSIFTKVLMIAAVVLFLFACNNETKPAEETKVDTPAVQPPPPVTTDTLPKVDTPATTRPDGSNN